MVLNTVLTFAYFILAVGGFCLNLRNSPLISNCHKMLSTGKSRGFGDTTPKPNVIVPNPGVRNDIEKFLMMYKCKSLCLNNQHHFNSNRLATGKKCSGQNAQMVSKVAYYSGIVVSTCKHCKVNHLIADNLGKLDMAEYGAKAEDYLRSKGESVTRITLTSEDLEKNYVIEKDGEIYLQPKLGGQPSTDVNIIDFSGTGADQTSQTQQK